MQPCDASIPCVPLFYKDEQPEIQKMCPFELLHQCYSLRDKEKIFYKEVNWDTLTKYFQDYMNVFVNRLSKDRDIAQLLQQVYTYGPYPPEEEWGAERPANFAYLEARVVKNDDFLKCRNLMVKLVLNRGVAAKPAPKEQEISHISLHPSTPKYYRDRLRSRSGCGYYPRPAACQLEEGQNSHPTDSGPFHYYINTLVWGQTDIPYIPCLGPTLEFLMDESNPGRFLSVIPGSFLERLHTIPIEFREEKLQGQNGVIQQARLRVKQAFNAAEAAASSEQDLANVEMIYEEQQAARQQAEAAGFSEEQIQKVLERVGKEVKRRFQARETAKKLRLRENQDAAAQQAVKQLRIRSLRNRGNIRNNETNNAGYTRVLAQRVERQLEMVNALHLLIYREFIEFWNTTMFPAKRTRKPFSLTTGQELPPIQRLFLRFKLGTRRTEETAPPAPKNTLKNETVITNASKLRGIKPVYTGFFLSNEASRKLFVVANEVISAQNPAFQYNEGYIIQAGHLTMAFGKDTLSVFEQIKAIVPENPIGLQIVSLVFGNVNGKPLVAARVALPAALQAVSRNENPHITIYHHKDVAPKESNELLKDSPPPYITDKQEIRLEMELPTSTGMFVSEKRGGKRKTRRLRAHKH